MLWAAETTALSSAPWRGAATIACEGVATHCLCCCRYDPALDQWSSVVSLTCCRSGVGLAVVNSQLYAGCHNNPLSLARYVSPIIMIAGYVSQSEGLMAPVI